MKSFSIQLSDDDYEQVKKIGKENERSAAAQLRIIVKEWLKSEKDAGK